MSTQRIDRVNELLQREIASSLYRLHTGGGELDLARITIARVICSPDLRKARVLVSVLHDSDEAPDVEQVVRALNRKRKEFQSLLASNVVLKYTPHLQFVADESLDGADRVLSILDHLPPFADETDLPDDVPEP